MCRGGHGDSEGIGASCGGGIRSRSRFPGGEVQFHYDDGVSATWSKAKGAFNVRTLIEVRSELGWFGWRRRQRTECTTVHVPRQFGEASFREHCLCVTQLC